MADVWLHIRADNLAEIESRLSNIESYLNEISKTHNLKFNTSGISQATRQVSQLESAASRVEGAFSKIGGAISKTGTLMQGLGNIFGGKVVGTVKTMTTAFATMGLYSAAQGTVERYDTMRMFPKMMEHLGYSAEDATAAVKKLEDAVIGLPTGLDEIVASARQLIPLTGDLDKGVNLAIAANNAFLAGGADANATRFGQRQIKDLLAKGTLRSQEWDSLFTALGSGLGVVAEAMGYSSQATKGVSSVNDEIKYAESRLKSLRNTQKRYEKEGGTAKAIKKNSDAIKTWEAELAKLQGQQDKSLGSFRAALKSNQIDALEFLDALEKVGTGEGELAKRADDYKDTISAAARNIKNAMQKLGAAGLEALDNILVEKTGKGIPGTIREISDSIKQNLVPAIEGWVSENGDKIVAFFDRLKNYDWIGLVSKVGNGLAKYYDIMTGFFTKVSPDIVAFLAVWAGPIGRFLQTAGSVVTGFGKVVGKLIKLFGSAGGVKAIGAAAKGASGLGNLVGSLKTAFAGIGLSAGYVAVVGEIGLVIGEYAKIIEMISNLNIGSDLSGKMTKVVTFASGVAAFTSVLVGMMSTAAGSGIGAGIVALGELLSAGFVGIVAEIGAVLLEFTNVLGSIGRAHLPDRSKISDFFGLIAGIADELAANGGVSKWFGTLTGSATVSNITKAMTNLTDIIKSMAKVQDTIAAMQAEGKFGVSNGELDISRITDFMEELIVGLENVTQLIYDNSTLFAEWAASKESGSIAKSIANINDIILSVADIQESIAKVNTRGAFGVRSIGKRSAMQWDDFEIYIRNIIRSMQNITEAITENSGIFAEWSAKSETKSILGAMENINDIIVAVSDMQTSIEQVNQKGRYGVRTIGKKSTFQWDDFEMEIRNIIRNMQNITETIDENSGLLAEWAAKKKTQNLFKSIEAIGSIITAVTDMQDNIAKMNETGRFGVHNLGGGRGKASMSSITQAIEEIISPLATSMKDLDVSGIGSDKTDAFKQIGDSTRYIKEALVQIASAQGNIDQLVDDNLAFSVGYKLQTIIESFSMFNEIAGENLTDLGTNMKSIYDAVGYLTGESGIITALKSVTESIGSLGIVEGVWPAGENLKTAIQTITGIFDNTSSIGAGANLGQLLGSAADNLSAIADTLKTLADNASAASGNLDQAASSLGKLGDAASKHKDAIKQAADAVKQLKSAVDGIYGKAFSAAMGVTALGSSAANQVGNLQAAASAASSLAAAINSIPTSKTVNVSVGGNVASSVGRSVGSGLLNTVRNAFGFAHGGEVRGPGGIDNVPSWLTSGEYVMTKRAHSTFGSRFMNRINNLDVEGAMRALSLRAGSGVFRGTTVTNNYTRDNHANVTFNVNRATQGYSQRRASRWARALS